MTGDDITIAAGDSVKVNIEIGLKIAGIDSAVVKISETNIPIEVPEIAFPTDIEIFSGKLKSLALRM